MICEVKDGRVLGNPHTIDGHKQQLWNGFNKAWKGWDDIQAMRAICAANTPCTRPVCSSKSSTATTTTTTGSSSFCVVSQGKLVGAYCDVNEAKLALNRNARGSRMICEVKDGRVMENPDTIDGHPQQVWNGFKKWWKNNEDMWAMQSICGWQTPCSRHVCSGKEETSFCVVSEGKVIGASCSVEEARQTLNQNARGSRMICEVKDGRVLGDPRTVGGHEQQRWNGFNKAWRDWDDIQAMRAICAANTPCTQPKC